MKQTKQMKQMKQIQDDEIDLFELFQTLWDGKWLISTFVGIAVLFGGSFLLIKKTEYESKLIYYKNLIPPFYKEDKVLMDFEKTFFSVSAFEDWKKNNSNTLIVFEDFSKTEVVDGFVLLKDEHKQLVKLKTRKINDPKDISFLLVRSNNLVTLNNFFQYATHINELLKNEYILIANKQLKIIETRLKNSDGKMVDGTSLKTILSIKRFVDVLENGANILTIERPLIPKKVSPRVSVILVVSVMLGGMIGVFFTLVRNTIKKRKEQLSTD